MSAHDTTLTAAVTREEVTPKVYDINWGKKVHPDGLVEFIAELHDYHEPLSYYYTRVYTDLVYSFLREHEDKDVLMSFDCTYRQKVYSTCTPGLEFVNLSYTCTSKTNTRFVKLGECEVEEAVEDLRYEICKKVEEDEPVDPDEFDEYDYSGYYSFFIGVTRFSIIFKLK